MQDGRLELDNDRSERSIKPFVIGRKNWLFANTPRGAKASATIYSVIETAKENGLNPFEYLKYLFEQLPSWRIPKDPGGWTDCCLGRPRCRRSAGPLDRKPSSYLTLAPIR